MFQILHHNWENQKALKFWNDSLHSHGDYFPSLLQMKFDSASILCCRGHHNLHVEEPYHLALVLMMGRYSHPTLYPGVDYCLNYSTVCCISKLKLLSRSWLRELEARRQNFGSIEHLQGRANWLTITRMVRLMGMWVIVRVY